MNLTVSKYLNARVDKPSVSAACNFYRIPGTIVEIDEICVGDPVDGSAIWYRSKTDGYFYWSGGFEQTSFDLSKTLSDFSAQDQFAIFSDLKYYFISQISARVHGYLGCGFGNKNSDEANGLAFIVYVDAKSSTAPFQVPSDMFYKGIGIPMDVMPVTSIQHQYTPFPNPPYDVPDNADPLPAGGTVGVDGSVDFGSRSLYVVRDNKTYLMTCFHVLLPEFKSFGLYVGSQHGFLHRANYPYAGSMGARHDDPVDQGFYTNTMDIALVQVSAARIANSVDRNSIDGFYRFSELPSLKGRQVKMVGSRSGIQTGKVIEVGASVMVDGHMFDHVIVCEKLSEKGDSGAPVIDNSHKLVGYIIAGSPDRSYLLSINPLIFNHHYTLK